MLLGRKACFGLVLPHQRIRMNAFNYQAFGVIYVLFC